MLGKLMKYEVKATTRLFIPVYIAVLLSALITRLFTPYKIVGASESITLQEIIGWISVRIYILLIFGIIAMTFIIMIERFYKNLLGDEGYLMFTIPVRTWEHILSKLIVSMLWFVLSFLTVICSVFVLIDPSEILSEVPKAISELRTITGDVGFSFIPVIAVALLVYSIVSIYNAIAFGHLFGKHKIIASFGAYVLIYFVSRAIYSIFIMLFIKANVTVQNDGITIYTNVLSTQSEITAFLISLACITIILAVANFVSAYYILKNRLNLE